MGILDHIFGDDDGPHPGAPAPENRMREMLDAMIQREEAAFLGLDRLSSVKPAPSLYPSPSSLAPPAMRAGETVAAYLERRKTERVEVRLVDGRGHTRIVRVPFGATEYRVPVPLQRSGSFTPDDTQTEQLVCEVVFTTHAEIKVFDKQNRPVWFPEAILRTHPGTWPRFAERESAAVDELDRAMHAELDQWQSLEGFDPHGEAE